MTRILIDENLPRSLVAKLGGACTHASEIAAQASDTLLWEYARERNWIILTRDTDFFDRLILYGSPPKIVWVRLGNLRRTELVETIGSRWEAILDLIEGSDMVEIHPDRLEALRFPQSPVRGKS